MKRSDVDRALAVLDAKIATLAEARAVLVQVQAERQQAKGFLGMAKRAKRAVQKAPDRVKVKATPVVVDQGDVAF